MASMMDPQNEPALAPPAGVISNFDNPPSRADTVRIISSISMAIMITFVALRLYSRLWVTRTFGKDDCACIMAMASSIGLIAVMLDTLRYGIGRHQWDVRAITLDDTFFKRSVIVQLEYFAAICFAKLSLFLLYLRLFSPSRNIRFLIHLGIAFTVLFYTSCLLIESIACGPRSSETWIEAVSSQRCLKINPLGLVIVTVNVCGDFYLLAIPISVVSKLQMPLRRKVGLCIVFGSGLLILNAYFTVQLRETKDATWNNVPYIITSVLEINVGISCSCTPHLTSLFRSQGTRTFPPRSLIYIKTLFGSAAQGPPDSSREFKRVDSGAEGGDVRSETMNMGTAARDQGKFMQPNAYPEEGLKNETNRNGYEMRGVVPSEGLRMD